MCPIMIVETLVPDQWSRARKYPDTHDTYWSQASAWAAPHSLIETLWHQLRDIL